MPWTTQGVNILKEEFIMQMKLGIEPLAKLCREYKISRKTAYKWIERYKQEGIIGLQEHSKKPCHMPIKTNEEQTFLILQTRDKYRWGAKKLRQYLINQGHTNLPCVSTFNRILKRHGKVTQEESSKRERFIRFEREKPNELWQMDFKGHFKLGEGRCYPLTVLDDHSRYSLCIKACKGEDEVSVRNALEMAFREYGLPEGMTMDNGSPWKGYPYNLSRLTVWLMRLGIKVGHSRPYHPQTQGKDERFHRSLKEEVLKYHQFTNFEQAQGHFDEWREIYNQIRPHEGIGMLCPYQRYKTSSSLFPEMLPAIEYRETDAVRKVGRCGQISFENMDYFIGEHLSGEYVAVRYRMGSQWDIYYCNTRIAGFKKV
jgi:transposase InsO family protein